MATGETTIVALAGPTCAYKTTVRDILVADFFPYATTLSFDEYDLYPSGSAAMDEELRSPTITNWEDPALFDEEAYVHDLAQLSKGLPVMVQARSRESMAANVTHQPLQPSELVIVEGVFAWRDPRALAYIALKIFMNLPEDEMVTRRLKAAETRKDDGPWHDPSYIRGAMIEGTRRYVMPQMDSADIVVDATVDSQELAGVLADRITQLL